MKPYTPRQKSLIVNSFKRVFQTGNIDHLTTPAYKFIMLASGFIAHYNLHGFQDYYRDTSLLKQDILQNKNINQWRNFQPGEADYEYYQAKAGIYNAIAQSAFPGLNESRENWLQ